MPLPVAHTLAGAAIYGALDADGTIGRRRRLLVAVVLANAPDLDLVPGILAGDPNRFHHGLSHTLLAAVLAGGVAAWLARRRGVGWPVHGWRRSAMAATFMMVASLWASHVVLDVLTNDPSPPFGVPALWPLVSAPIALGPLFLRADKVVGPASGGQFVLSLLSAHNLTAILRETLLLGPFVALARLWRRRRRS